MLIAKVVKKLWGLSIRDPLLNFVDVVFDVTICNKNVLMAVEIQIKEKAAESQGQQASLTHGGCGRFIHKQTLALVVIEIKHFVGEVRDNQAGIAGAVIGVQDPRGDLGGRFGRGRGTSEV